MRDKPMDSDNRNRITLLIGSLSSGGAERVVCNLANYLYDKGFRVDVLTLTNKNDNYSLNKGINRVCLLDATDDSNKIVNLFRRWSRLKRYVRENSDIECYITMLPLTIFMLTSLRKRINGKIIVSDRNNPASYKHIYRFMVNYGVRRCDGLVVQTKEISEWYKNVNNKIVIPNAINKDINISKRSAIEHRVVAVGRLEKQKNYPMIIKAFNRFNVKHPDYLLEIYGVGSEEKKLKKLIGEEGLDNKVRFIGYVKDVSERISNAACFLMASNYEGMPNALIESMCIGIPCIATDCDGGGARELIINMENGILIKKDAIDEMALSMNKIVEDEAFCKKISKNARMLKKKLDPEIIYEKWLTFIKERGAFSVEGEK